jgi:hypothetical protein
MEEVHQQVVLVGVGITRMDVSTHINLELQGVQKTDFSLLVIGDTTTRLPYGPSSSTSARPPSNQIHSSTTPSFSFRPSTPTTNMTSDDKIRKHTGPQELSSIPRRSSQPNAISSSSNNPPHPSPSSQSPSLPAKKVSNSVTFAQHPPPSEQTSSSASSFHHRDYDTSSYPVSGSSSGAALNSNNLGGGYTGFPFQQQQQQSQNQDMPHGSPTTPSVGAVDGREFFKKARSTLSYDEFTTLLANVKS